MRRTLRCCTLRVDREPAVSSTLIRNALHRLPTDVKRRLVEIPQHVRALSLILAELDEDEYVRLAERGDCGDLVAVDYPLERAVEIVDRYVCELAAIAVHRACGVVGEPHENLRLLDVIGVTSPHRGARLAAVHASRDWSRHPADAASRRELIRTAALLARHVTPFLREYTSWFLQDTERAAGGASAKLPM